MTLQEKIDSLPLSIEKNKLKYQLFLSIIPETVDLQYWHPLTEDFLLVTNKEIYTPISQRIEDVVDRALLIIENKEWEE